MSLCRSLMDIASGFSSLLHPYWMLTHPKGVHCPAPPALSLLFRWPSQTLSDFFQRTFSFLFSSRGSCLFCLRLFDAPTEPALSLRVFCSSTGCPAWYIFCRLSTKRFPPALLFPLSLSQLFHTPSELRNQIVEARLDYFLLSCCGNLRRRVQRRQLNSGELDVTPMSKDIAATSSQLSGAESGNKEPNKLSTKPPYSSDGGRTYSLARKSAIHVQRSECTTTVKSSEYPIPRPGEHYHIIIITDYNKSCSCVPCLSH